MGSRTGRPFLATAVVLLAGCNDPGSGSGPGGVPNPAAGTLQFSAASFAVSEGAGMATLTVTRTGGSAGAVGVFASIASGGTATSGQDYPQYIDWVATLQWADGDAADKTFTIPITDDSLPEPDETVNLALVFPTGGAALGSPNTAVLTIVDNDSGSSPAGTLQFSAGAYTVSEGGIEATMTVTRRGGSAGAVGVNVAAGGGTATSGQDYPQYIDWIATLQWADGDVADKTFTFPVFEDSVPEGDETVQLDLTMPTGGAALGTPSTALLTIVDND